MDPATGDIILARLAELLGPIEIIAIGPNDSLPARRRPLLPLRHDHYTLRPRRRPVV